VQNPKNTIIILKKLNHPHVIMGDPGTL
jgi:hypothetical protein